jgi:hypothetical protein
MFIESVIASFVILIGCNAAVWCRKWWLSLPILGLGVFSITTLTIAVSVQSFFTFLGLILLLIPKVGRYLFAIASIAAMVFAYWMLFNSADKQHERYEELREKYPLVSMAERVPMPKRTERRELKSERQLIELETDIPKKQVELNVDYLYRLHTDNVRQFIDQPGFGFDRMANISEDWIKWQMSHAHDKESIYQPEKWLPSDAPVGDIFTSASLIPLNQLHYSSVFDFVNPAGFGYVKSRTEVAGFQSHRFSKYPTSTTGWSVRTVELVGILVHDTPAVYLSEHLPRMDELKGAKTRPLDVFEKEGLAELEKGEELFVRGKDDSARMMGAIRNAKQCVECHGGQRGDLLGAFSYRLKK